MSLTQRLFAVLLLLATNFAVTQSDNEKPWINSRDAKINRERGLIVLSRVKDEIKEYYYDPSFHGVDFNQIFNAAQEEINGLQTNLDILDTIALTVQKLDDSHTMFLPPYRLDHVEYGFSLQMIGDKCYIVDVRKGSDAEAQGLKIGDVVVSVGDIATARNTLWKIQYFLYYLEHRRTLTLTVKKDDGSTRVIETHSRMFTADEWRKELERRTKELKIAPELKSVPYKCKEIGGDVIACKLYSFMESTGNIDDMMRKSVAGHKKLILDLRGNPGGLTDTATHLIGYFFDHPVNIGTEVSRGHSKPLIAKNQSSHEFGGDLIVLVDSRSASSSEMFARVMQIEKRGKVVGDVTAGMVMVARRFPLLTTRVGMATLFGVEVTVADLVMSDGQRLEGKGVVPDVAIVPTGRALAETRDPILAYAAKMDGVQLPPEDAGKFYFITRPPEPNPEENP